MMPGMKRSVVGEKGFSLIEMVVVVGIIGIMAAVALPNIAGYIRNYQIRGAALLVAGQLQQARSRAIMKNVSLGVVWGMTNATATRSQVVVEDDLRPNSAPNWTTVAAENFSGTLMLDSVQSVSTMDLPTGIRFDDPANCPGGVAGTGWGLRFNRLGSVCEPGVANCGPVPPNPPPGPPRVAFNGGSVMLCLFQPLTGLRKTVTVTPGGRVLAQP